MTVPKKVVYVEFIESAPWNLPQIQSNRCFIPGSVLPDSWVTGVGTALIHATISPSEQLGCEGRIGLHSLPEAETYYAEKLAMHRVEAASKEGLAYYEMDSTTAAFIFRQEQIMTDLEDRKAAFLAAALEEDGLDISAGIRPKIVDTIEPPTVDSLVFALESIAIFNDSLGELIAGFRRDLHRFTEASRIEATATEPIVAKNVA